ncbi:hypothetical protein Pcinc_039218 [Petrolisthes cinctipes]|uniref:Uncharacterized protein n=1 Tax=Petrolisthes cinctipes TaxID=88211 RepID=A0AAE1BNW0_PETCI|nr:hypothetical protein Pcinc_039218 [Petrolisthes cinctipes]
MESVVVVQIGERKGVEISSFSFSSSYSSSFSSCSSSRPSHSAGYEFPIIHEKLKLRYRLRPTSTSMHVCICDPGPWIDCTHVNFKGSGTRASGSQQGRSLLNHRRACEAKRGSRVIAQPGAVTVARQHL